MPDSKHYELIATVINTDLSTPVMEAARKAGCHGGTLVKAREMCIRDSFITPCFFYFSEPAEPGDP